jgi:alkylation response protein AidB-like acyl-CoA dehydrogenase
MVDEITRLARTKKRVLDPHTVGERGAFQQELGRTDATLRASRAYMMSELDRALELAEATGGPLAPREQARVSAALSYATEALVEAAGRLFPYAGAGALHLDHPIQRTYRDLIGSGQHLVATNENLDAWGRALLESEDTA